MKSNPFREIPRNLENTLFYYSDELDAARKNAKEIKAIRLEENIRGYLVAMCEIGIITEGEYIEIRHWFTYGRFVENSERIARD